MPGQTNGGPARTAEPPAITFAKLLRALCRARTDALGVGLGIGLFGDPGWDILLDLYIARHHHKRLSVTDLGFGISGSPATAIRYIGILQSVGLVMRVPDPVDGRRSFVQLSESGHNSLETLFSRFAAC